MQIPKFQNPAKPLYPWKPSEQQEAVNKFVDSKLNEVKQIVKTADKRNSRLREADKRANRNVKTPYRLNNTAKLQEALYNVGAYNDMRNRRGTSLSYEQAVDGIHGKMTDAAVAKAREMGYDVNISEGTITKQPVIIHRPSQEERRERFLNQEPSSTVKYEKTWFGNLLDKIAPTGKKEQKYSDTEIYTGSDDWYQKEGTYGNLYRSRLGDLGLVASKDGTYKLYDKNGKLIDQCAQTVNALQQMLGKHQNTTGNAWTSQGMFGDSMLVNGYKYLPKIGGYNKVTHTLQNLAAVAAVQPQLESLDLQTGDVVGLYSANSAHNDEAWNEGTRNRSNSHEGIVFRPFPKRKDKTYIIHNINGNISVDPISNFMVSKSGLVDWAPTYVMRPNKRPSETSKKVSDPLTYKEYDQNGNIYNILTMAGRRKYGIDLRDNRTYYLQNGKVQIKN